MIWKIFSAALALVVLAGAIPAVRHLREVPPSPAPVIRAQLAVPGGVTIGSGPEPLDAAISPDERRIAFIATRDGMTALWLESVATGSARALDGTEGASLPAWSRDGQSLAFFAQGKLHALTLSSSAVTALVDAGSPAGVAWLPDGSVLFVSETGGVVRRLALGVTSDVTTLAPGDVSHAFPFVNDTGRLLYIAVRQNGARVVRLLTELDGTTKAPPYSGQSRSIDLTETAGHAEMHGGVLVHVRDDVLLAQRLDDSSRRLVGRSLPLGTGVGHSEGGHGYFAASRGTALWAAALPRATELAWFDQSGQRTGTATEPGDYWQLRLSPSGREVAVTTLDPLLRTLDVMVVPLTAPGNARRVSLGIGPDTDPVWSPNGAAVIYRSAQSGAGAILTRPAAQSANPEETVLRKSTDVTPSDWRGNTLLFHMLDPSNRRVIVALDRGRNLEMPLTSGGFNGWDGRWSPDGRWMAYTSDESGQPDVYVQAWPGGMPRVRATFGGGQRPQWGPDGALFFRRGNVVMRANLSGSPQAPIVSTPQAVLTAAGLRDFAVSPVGNRVLAIAEVEGTRTPTAQLIVNWMTEVPEVKPR